MLRACSEVLVTDLGACAFCVNKRRKEDWLFEGTTRRVTGSEQKGRGKRPTTLTNVGFYSSGLSCVGALIPGSVPGGVQVIMTDTRFRHSSTMGGFLRVSLSCFVLPRNGQSNPEYLVQQAPSEDKLDLARSSCNFSGTRFKPCAVVVQ